MTAGKTFYLETFGCQMNVLDSELVLGELLALGWRPTRDMRRAELVVFNTCSVRQHAEDKVFSRLGRLSARGGAAAGRIVAVIGCMAERDGPDLLRRAPHVDVLCGPSDLHRLPDLVEEVRANRGRALALSGRGRAQSTPPPSAGRHDDLESLDSSRVFDPRLAVAAGAPGPHHAYVRITRGCNKWCTFCVVPLTRGPEVHRPPDQIIAEVRRLAAAGVREVTLLGQTVNHYRHVDDRGRVIDFARLLARVHDEVEELPRLRFVTSYPRDFTDEALRVMAGRPRICRYLHIPAQSGSDAVLKRMNRGYTVAQYRALLDRARDLMPNVCLAGDMIVGFPGESERDFEQSVELVRFARYKNCFIFKYSPRPGTVADGRFPDDVPDEVKRRRNNDLLAVQAGISLAANRTLVGREVEVLVAGFSKTARRVLHDGGGVREGGQASPRQLVGRTTGDQIVVFDGPSELIGRLVRVRVLAATPFTLTAALANSVDAGLSPGRDDRDAHVTSVHRDWDVLAAMQEGGPARGVALPVLAARA